MNGESGNLESFRGMWWLATADKPDGPFTQDTLLEQLKSGHVTDAALACPVGGNEWKSIAEWPEFAGATPACHSDIAPNEAVGCLMDSPVTNRQLPPFANWICIYTLVVLPIYWLVSNLTCLAATPSFREESDFFLVELLGLLIDVIVSFGIVVALFFGGLRLRNLRRSGTRLLMIGTWIDLTYSLLKIPVVIAVVLAAGPDALAETTPAADIVEFFFNIIGLSAFAFEVLVLVWLHRNRQFLPLQDM